MKVVGNAPIYEASTRVWCCWFMSVTTCYWKFSQKGGKTVTPKSQLQTSIILQCIVLKAPDKDATVEMYWAVLIIKRMLHTTEILLERSDCHWLWIDGKKAQLECHRRFVNENGQHLTTESKATNLNLAGRQVALAVEGTSASCKQCVMSILYLPPQRPSGSRLEGRRLQNAGTAAFPTEKRHF